MEWFDDEKQQWIAAIYHDNLREELIQIASASNPDYDVPPVRGSHPHDITSNCGALSQNTWQAETAEQRAQILDADGIAVMTLDDKPERTDHQLPPEWHHRGLIVLDQESHPILNWPNIPLCLSSKLEGWRIEALRRVIPGLEASHLRARMPRFVEIPGNVQKPIYGLSTLRHRASRYRDVHRIGAWDEVSQSFPPMLKA